MFSHQLLMRYFCIKGIFFEDGCKVTQNALKEKIS